jgi:mannose-6-phosphate isomerase-like protein (cupin superfamily)
MGGYAVRAIDEMEGIHHGAVKLAGAELQVESFGVQVLDFPAGFDGYPEHDHAADGQEEVYLVLRGSAGFTIDGALVPAAPGTMVRVAPESRRRIDPGPDGVRILAIGSVVEGSPYERPADFRLGVRS